MHLTCPHCTRTGSISDGFKRYFGMPVACHNCFNVYFVKPSPDEALAMSINDKNHSMRCSGCGLQLIVAGDRRQTRDSVLSCPACHSRVIHQPGFSTSRVMAIFAGLCLMVGALLALLHFTHILTIDPVNITKSALYYTDQISIYFSNL